MSAEEQQALESLLLVDDDPLITDSLGFVLEEDFQVLTAQSRPEARQILQHLAEPPRLALIDLGLPPEQHLPEQGFRLVEELLAFNPDMKILILSGQNDRANIQHALTLGAVDFVAKPCEPDLLMARLRHQTMMLQAEQQASDTHTTGEGELIGDSAAVATLREMIRQFSEAPFPVLIEGESGSGKELVAQALHDGTGHPERPYLTINCAAFSGDLLDAQLFGHAKGAFTGADSARSGFFEDAANGSLFLDEIGEMPLELQAKLLRVLENGEYYRLGETRARKASARIIAATNRDLHEAVRTGQFRQDLYHRISVLSIRVPPLRERGRDCLILLDHFRQLYAASATPFTLSETARQYLLEYSFPGNVRELRNVVIRLGAKYAGQEIGLESLTPELESTRFDAAGEQGELSQNLQEQIRAPGFRLDVQLATLERKYIQTAMDLTDGNLSKAARLLGINRTTLYSKLQKQDKT